MSTSEDTYTTPRVRRLLAMAYDPDRGYSSGTRWGADPSALRLRGDPSSKHDLIVELVDVREALAGAALTEREHRALLLRYVFDWPNGVVAEFEGVTESTISKRTKAALRKLTEHLEEGPKR